MLGRKYYPQLLPGWRSPETEQDRNDCNDNVDTANAGQRLQVMVDDILNSIPGVTVIISTLAKSRDHDSCASNVSQQFRDLVKNSYGGKRVGLADFNAVMTSSMLVDDGIHPNVSCELCSTSTHCISDSYNRMTATSCSQQPGGERYL